MIYKTHESLAYINFSDSLNDLISKIEVVYKKGTKEFMGTFNPTIYLVKEDVLIVFSEDGNSIEYIEIGKNGNCLFNGINIFKTKYSELEEKISKLDSSLEFSEGGFDSHKCGLGIYRGLRNGKYSIYPKSVIVFNKNYESKKTPSVDDIINFYLGRSRGK